MLKSAIRSDSLHLMLLGGRLVRAWPKTALVAAQSLETVGLWVKSEREQRKGSRLANPNHLTQVFNQP